MEKATDLRGILKVIKPEPLKGKDFDDFFVETDEARGENSASHLAEIFLANQDTPQKVLFMGHRGSGKSTELYRFSRYIEDKFKVINFSVKDKTYIVDLEYTDLLFVTLKMLYDEAVADNIALDKRILENLDHYWNDEVLIEKLKIEKAGVETGAQVKGGIWNFLSFNINGILSTGSESKAIVRDYIKPRLSKLIADSNDFITVITREYLKQGKTPILILEDMDKLDLAVAEELFLKRTNILTALNIHVVYTFPIFLHYSGKFNEIESTFDYYELLSMIKVRDIQGHLYSKGIDIIRKIVGKRAELRLFDEEALTFIIEKSGGSIRHVFEMIQNAVLNERMRNSQSQILGIASATTAFKKLRNYFERTIEKHHLDALKAIYSSADKKPMPDPKLKELLNSMAVIEYNGDRWCHLHPAVEEILKEKGEIGHPIIQC